MDRLEAIDWIKQVANYRCGVVKAIAITGGEPFCEFETTQAIASRARQLGLLVTVVTNAFWAESRQRAVEMIRAVHGICAIAFSYDAYHEEFVRIERLEHAVMAAVELGIPYQIPVCTESTTSEEYVEVVERIKRFADAQKIRTVLTYSAGRASAGVAPSADAAEPCDSACSVAAAPMIFPNGRVMGCIGPLANLQYHHPLELGNLREERVQSILDRAETNAILHALRVWGPRKILEESTTAGETLWLPTRFVKGSVCDACLKTVGNRKAQGFLSAISSHPSFRREVAWGRLYYLGEDEFITREPQLRRQ